MKQLINLFLLSLLKFSLVAQTTNSILPNSFSQKGSNLNIPLINMPSFDLQKTIEDNNLNIKNGTGMYMFGFEHQVSIPFFNNGVWTKLNNGARICRLALTSSHAISLNLIFNDFYLEEGSYLHIYNENKSIIDGAYTSLNNNVENRLGTDIIKGDKIIIEFFEPKNSLSLSRLNIGMVVHGYLDITNWKSQLKVNESGNCNMDVICPDGDLWRNEIKAVARIVNGGGLCSGTLVNNTNQDGKPYFLTANHCSPQSMSTAVFRFNYDSPICGSQTAANSQTATSNDLINGSTFKARNSNSDFGLVLLNTVPPASYGVYYAGWNNSGDIPVTTVGIHHPQGDVKKISFDDSAPVSSNFGSSGTNAEWKVLIWDRNTTTEGGSSGSGLWDENHLIVGQLHGGQANCSNSVNDFYGKFSVSWNGNSSTNRLHDWLDPSSSGVSSLIGYDPNASLNNVSLIKDLNTLETNCGNAILPELIVKNLGVENLETLTFKYGVNNYASTYNWSGNIAPNESLLIQLPSVVVGSLLLNEIKVQALMPNNGTDGDTLDNYLSYEFTNNIDCYAFPNPFLNELTINLELEKIKNTPVYISISDIQGKTLWSVTYSESGRQMKLNTSTFSSGAYVLKIEYKDQQVVQKLIKI